MLIRPAEERDLPAITAIYNDVLLHSTAIYRDDPVTVDERRAWWRSRLDQGYPVLVAERDAEVIAFASYGDFRFGSGYRFTVEGTLHVASHARGRGTGTALFHALVHQAHQAGIHMLIGGVDAANTVSLRFLEKLGFQRAGFLYEVGYKFDRYLDLVLLQYRIP